MAALGGSAVAAKLITGKQIKDRSITGRDLKSNTITGRVAANLSGRAQPSAEVVGELVHTASDRGPREVRPNEPGGVHDDQLR